MPTRRRTLIACAAAAGAVAVPVSWCRTHQAAPAVVDDSTATIALGDPRNSHLGIGARVDRQPVGVDFLDHDWPFDQLGTVRYAQGPYSFEVPRVSSVMGAFDRDEPERGIFAWSITAYPMAGERIAHALARDRLFEFFRQLRDAGWRRYIDFGDPRLSGRQTMRYFVEQRGNYCPDPAYVPDLDEWMQLNKKLPYWQFWADGSYMLVRVIDEPSLRNPARQGVYMFDINIESEAMTFQSFFAKAADKKRWTELLPAELARLHQLRAADEASLRQRGYVIDTSYEDPPILALRHGT